MPTPAAVGLISSYLDTLKTTIAKSANFQSITGTTGDEAAAKAKVVENSNAVATPRAMVGPGRGLSTPHDTNSGWSVTGPLEVMLEFDVTTAYEQDYDAALREWRNRAGQIIDDIHTLVNNGTDGVLATITNIEIVGDEVWLTKPGLATKFVSGSLLFHVMGI